MSPIDWNLNIRPTFNILVDGYILIDGQILDKTYLTYLGPVLDIQGGRFVLGSTYLDSSQ